MSLSSITITSDCTLDVVLNGAGGGTGGNDAGHIGGRGSNGDKVTCSINALAGQTYYISTGSAGQNGSSNVRAGGGGAGGYAFNGFSGGGGGNAGGIGTSGGGGGGGGATLLYTIIDGTIKYLAVAAGGFGGGGAGNYSNATEYTNSTAPSHYFKYYNPVVHPAWGYILNTYGVNSSTSTTLSYTIFVEQPSACILYGSADDEALIYINGTYVGSSATYTSVSRHDFNLNYGANTIDIQVINSGGGPWGYGAYIMYHSGRHIWNTRSAYNMYDYYYHQGRGGLGQSHLYDGGGAGGGGGGYYGGAGGTSAGYGYGGDYGAYSGIAGGSFAPTSNNYIQSQFIKERWSTVNGASIVRYGGSNTDGSFSVSSLSSNIKIKQLGSFKSVSDIKYKVNGVWTPVNEAYVRQNNQWAPMFKNNTFTVTSQAGGGSPENNVSGYMVPYAAIDVYDILI
jgi:hypothetical protein